LRKRPDRRGQDLVEIETAERSGEVPSMRVSAVRPSTVISRRRRRHQDTWVFSAVRTTQARGAGCSRTLRQDIQARVNASATRSSASCLSPTLTSTIRRQSSLEDV
jgi:hypothetical protein